MTRQEALELLAVPKIAVGWGGFKPRANHAGNVIGNASLTDRSGIYLPGVTLQVEVRAPIVADRCFYLFTILKRPLGGVPIRAYQLEIVPANKCSHRGASELFGPHEHIGDENEPDAVVVEGVNCGNWANCFDWFKFRTNITLAASPPC